MVDRGEGAQRLPYTASVRAQAIESLRGGYLMNKMKINVQERELPCRFADEMPFPYFLK